MHTLCSHRQFVVGVLASAATSYDKRTKRWKGITKAFTLYIPEDMVPIQTVVRDGFRHAV